MMRTAGLALLLTITGGHAMAAIDINALWDYRKPEVSEQRFRDALATASPADAFLLQTQIARSWGLRKDFARAREVLAALEPSLPAASPEGRVRYFLELGRTWASPAHTPQQRSAEARERARPLYLQAFENARSAGLDSLAIDALHMMVMVDEAPAEQLAWNLKAVAYMEASTQADAKKWAGSLYNNTGYALQQAGRHDEAIAHYRKSLAVHEAAGRTVNVRIAHWMIASALRAQGKHAEALAIQQRLEKEWDAAGEPDPYVYEELEHLHRALGDEARAKHYAEKLRAARK
jgi:tetratricopeptide (TPR) repeat protein